MKGAWNNSSQTYFETSWFFTLETLQSISLQIINSLHLELCWSDFCCEYQCTFQDIAIKSCLAFMFKVDQLIMRDEGLRLFITFFDSQHCFASLDCIISWLGRCMQWSIDILFTGERLNLVVTFIKVLFTMHLMRFYLSLSLKVRLIALHFE